MALQKRASDFGHEVKLVEVQFFPGDGWVRGKARLTLFSRLVNRLINFPERACSGVCHNLWPGLISLAEGNSVGMLHATISAERLISRFRYVRPAHNDRHSDRTDSISHAVGARHHSRHRANSHEANLFGADELNQFLFSQGLCVAINQQNFVFGWCERLEQEHPQMGHKIASHPVIRVVQKNSHVHLLQDGLGGSPKVGKSPVYAVATEEGARNSVQMSQKLIDARDYNIYVRQRTKRTGN